MSVLVLINKTDQVAMEAETAPDGSYRPINGVHVKGTEYNPFFTSSSVSGTIAAGAIDVSIANIGSANATVLGASLPSGAVISWGNIVGSTLAEISYDATGTTILISGRR